MVLPRTFTQEEKDSETETKEMIHIEMVHRNRRNGKSTDRRIFVQWKKILTHCWEKDHDICMQDGHHI